MQEFASTVTSKGQITIPKAVRERLGVGPHDRVAFIVDGEDVKIVRKQSVVQRTAGIVHSRVSFATAAEMRAAAEETIAEDAYRRMNAK
jgi:antitoxin PrlF